MEESNYVLDPSGIAEIVKHGGCPMYTNLRYSGDEKEKEKNWKEAFRPLSPLLLYEGNRFEREKYDLIKSDSFYIEDEWSDYDNQRENDKKIIDCVKKAEQDTNCLLLQPHLVGDICGFKVLGDSDVIFITKRDEIINIDIYDIKASWEESTEHRIQVAVYSILIEKLLDRVDFDYEYTINTGIITREESVNIDKLNNLDLSTFEKKSYVVDVKNMLSDGGVIKKAINKNIENTPHQFDKNCHNCSFKEYCFSKSIEELDIRLLGITRGEQEALRKEGINTIEDVAKLIEPIESPKPYEYEWPSIKSEYNDLVNRISENNSVGERLPMLAQRAQSLLGKIKNTENAYNKPWLQWKIGSGNGDLPDDDPPGNWSPSTKEKGELIRVYLNIQKDYIQDSIYLLSGRINCRNYKGSAFTFSESLDEIPNSRESKTNEEKELLEGFFKKLFNSIEDMASIMGKSNASVHLYFYTSQEEKELIDAVKKYPSNDTINTVRDILGMRGAIDQQMTSIIQDEITSRLLPKTLQTGVFEIYNQMYIDGKNKIDDNDWRVSRENKNPSLKDIFYYDLFDYNEKYKKDGENIVFPFDGSGDNWYPLRGGFGAQIPLEYFWGCEEINHLTPEITDNKQYKTIIEKYRWQNNKRKEVRVKKSDLENLSEVICKILEAIERKIKYKNPDIEKKRLDFSRFTEISFGDSNLSTSCIEYLDLEYQSEREDILSHYRKPIKQRILSGESIPIEITSVEIIDGLLYAEGRTIYDKFNFNSPKTVANSCKKKGSEKNTGGSRMVATPLKTGKNGELKEKVNNPEKLLNSTTVTIENLDMSSFSISIRSFPDGGSKDDEYRTWHWHYTTDPDEDDETFFAEGQKFILDPSSDNLTAQRARVALENTENNTMYSSLEKLLDGKSLSREAEQEKKRTEEFLNIVENRDGITPNKKQKEFIKKHSNKFNILQGPPGTGKTSGALSIAVISRLYNANDKNVLVTGTSNKSIDELLEDINKVKKKYSNESEAIENTKLIRLTGEKPNNPIDGVEYVNYHTDKDKIDEIQEILQKDNSQSTISKFSQESKSNLVIFSTPSRVYGFVNKLAERVGMSAKDAYSRGMNLFDYFVEDEASMQPLPQLLMSGAFIDEEGNWQALIAGDQRQMPPVQKHEWKYETRRTIEETVPFLSTLDYLRFLRGEEMEKLEEFDELESPNVDIPMTRLEETFRCHKNITNFLQKWIYSKDNIDYKSSNDETINQIKTGNEPLDKILSSEPMNLIVHREDESEQSNVMEANIISEIVNRIPDEESIGVVTPHNSQKGLIRSKVSNEDVTVDTVERFQGGEKDVMIVSATVSEPDYIQQESEFILNPNRLTVALSRMEKKLIVIAPKTLFNLIPLKIEEYEKSKIWKGLRHEISESVWKGNINDIIEQTDKNEEIEIFKEKNNK